MMEFIENTKYEVLTNDGFKDFDGYYVQEKNEYLKFTFENKNFINVSVLHKFFSYDVNDWKYAKEIEIGEELRTKEGSLTVSSIEHKNENAKVADLSNVKDVSSYIANGVDCHNTLFLDEVAHIEPNKFHEFFDSVYPTIAAGRNSKLIMVSTPKGLNHWYSIFNNAKNGRNNFAWKEITWRSVPGRDEKWAEEERANMGEMRFAQEHEVDFLGSSNTLISPNVIKNLSPSIPKKADKEETYRIYEMPQEDRVYIMSCDVSRGKGLDNSAFNIIDVTEYPFKQVASFSSNKVSPFAYTEIIWQFGKKYNDAFVLIENNEIGGQVVHDLNYDMEYENIISAGETSTKGELGVRTTKTTKRKGAATLKEMVENSKLIIQDAETITEMSGFIAKNNSYEADKGFTDDSIMSLIVFCWFATQELFNDLTDQDVRQKLREQSLDEEDMVPAMGFFDDGTEEFEEDTSFIGF